MNRCRAACRPERVLGSKFKRLVAQHADGTSLTSVFPLNGERMIDLVSRPGVGSKASAMKTKINHPNAFYNRCFLIGLSGFVVGTILAALASSGFSTAVRSSERKSNAVRRAPDCSTGSSGWCSEFLDANKRTTGGRRYRVSEQLHRSGVCRDAGRRNFSLE